MSSNASMLRQMVGVGTGERASSARRKILFHLVHRRLWDDAEVDKAGSYTPPTFEQDGNFVQAAHEHSLLLDVANRFYSEVEGDFLLLMIDMNHRRIRGKVRFEASDITHIFPQIHCPIPVDAVVGRHLVARNAGGEFTGIVDLVQWNADLSRVASAPVRPALPPPERRDSDANNAHMSMLCFPLSRGCDTRCCSTTEQRPAEFGRVGRGTDEWESSHHRGRPLRRIVSVGDDERQMDVRLYIAGGVPSRSVIVFPPATGVTSILERRCAELASAMGDCIVVAPDFFRGRPWQPPQEEPASSTAPFNKWAAMFPWGMLQSDLYLLVLPMLLEEGVPEGSMAVLGFGWGAYAALKCSADNRLVRAGVLCHPALQVSEAVHNESVVKLLEETRVPQLVLTAGNDAALMKGGGIAQSILNAAPETQGSQFSENPSLAHGAFLINTESGTEDETESFVEEHIAQIARFVDGYLLPLLTPPPNGTLAADGTIDV